MASTVQRSSTLFKQSWSVIRSHPALLVFPVFSTIASLALLAVFALPILLDDATYERFMDSFRSASKNHPPADGGYWGYVVLYTYFFVSTMATTFFNAALLGAADRALRGEPTGVGAGLQTAMKRFPQIFAWCVVNALFGLLLSLIERRVPLAGKLAVRLVGLAWGIACFFVLPVLVLEGVGPISAVRRSAAALKKNWGESLVLTLGFGAIGSVVIGLTVFLVIAGVVAGVLAESMLLGGTVVGLGVAVLLAWLTVASALGSVVNLALYRYASEGMPPAGFTQDALMGAFRAKA